MLPACLFAAAIATTSPASDLSGAWVPSDDPRPGHLVGTRDGKRFRLARLVLYKPAGGDCVPPPP